jgi:uncharacterized membrane protein
MALIGMSLWMFFLLTAVAVWGVVFYVKKSDSATRRRALMLGLFLLAFDFIFENLGASAGLWQVRNNYKLLAVPLEVMAITFLAGYTYALLFPKKFDLRMGVASSLLIAVAGVFLESLLTGPRMIVYTGGWDSYSALIAYFFTFMILNWVNARLK